jgi:hypothetical protein
VIKAAQAELLPKLKLKPTAVVALASSLSKPPKSAPETRLLAASNRTTEALPQITQKQPAPPSPQGLSADPSLSKVDAALAQVRQDSAQYANQVEDKNILQKVGDHLRGGDDQTKNLQGTQQQLLALRERAMQGVDVSKDLTSTLDTSAKEAARVGQEQEFNAQVGAMFHTVFKGAAVTGAALATTTFFVGTGGVGGLVLWGVAAATTSGVIDGVTVGLAGLTGDKGNSPFAPKFNVDGSLVGVVTQALIEGEPVSGAQWQSAVCGTVADGLTGGFTLKGVLAARWAQEALGVGASALQKGLAVARVQAANTVQLTAAQEVVSAAPILTGAGSAQQKQQALVEHSVNTLKHLPTNVVASALSGGLGSQIEAPNLVANVGVQLLQGTAINYGQASLENAINGEGPGLSKLQLLAGVANSVPDAMENIASHRSAAATAEHDLRIYENLAPVREQITQVLHTEPPGAAPSSEPTRADANDSGVGVSASAVGPKDSVGTGGAAKADDPLFTQASTSHDISALNDKQIEQLRAQHGDDYPVQWVENDPDDGPQTYQGSLEAYREDRERQKRQRPELISSGLPRAMVGTDGSPDSPELSDGAQEPHATMRAPGDTQQSSASSKPLRVEDLTPQRGFSQLARAFGADLPPQPIPELLEFLRKADGGSETDSPQWRPGNVEHDSAAREGLLDKFADNLLQRTFEPEGVFHGADRNFERYFKEWFINAPTTESSTRVQQLADALLRPEVLAERIAESMVGVGYIGYDYRVGDSDQISAPLAQRIEADTHGDLRRLLNLARSSVFDLAERYLVDYQTEHIVEQAGLAPDANPRLTASIRKQVADLGLSDLRSARSHPNRFDWLHDAAAWVIVDDMLGGSGASSHQRDIAHRLLGAAEPNHDPSRLGLIVADRNHPVRAALADILGVQPNKAAQFLDEVEQYFAVRSEPTRAASPVPFHVIDDVRPEQAFVYRGFGIQGIDQATLFRDGLTVSSNTQSVYKDKITRAAAGAIPGFTPGTHALATGALHATGDFGTARHFGAVWMLENTPNLASAALINENEYGATEKQSRSTSSLGELYFFGGLPGDHILGFFKSKEARDYRFVPNPHYAGNTAKLREVLQRLLADEYGRSTFAFEAQRPDQ